MNLNRIVAVLTPLVFAPLAGTICALLAQHFPGVDVDQRSLEQVFIAGALIALAPAAQWLHGWQKHEARQAELERDVALASVAAPATAALAPAVLPEEDVDELDVFDEDDELDDLGELDASDEEEDLGELDDLDELDELDALDALAEGDGDDPLDDEDDLIAIEG
jgi:hypothetical protein